MWLRLRVALLLRLSGSRMHRAQNLSWELEPDLGLELELGQCQVGLGTTYSSPA